MSRKKPAPLVNPTWLQESRNFSVNVINDTLQYLREDGKMGLSSSERKALIQLEVKWMNKLKPNERRPKSNRRPLTPPPPSIKQKRKVTKTKQLDQQDNVEDLDLIKDDEIIINRICIPRLKTPWLARQFDIRMPAHVLKTNLISSVFNWPLLDRIMDLSESEGRDILQNCVDKVLQQTD